MRRELFFAVTGAVAILFGLGFLVMPDMSLRTYGVPAEPHNVMQARYFGSALLAIGIVSWMARDTQDAKAIRAILVAGLVMDVIGALVSVAATGSLMNAMGWVSVAIYGAFAAGGAYLLFAGARPAQVQSQSG